MASPHLCDIQNPKNSEAEIAGVSKPVLIESSAPHIQHEPNSEFASYPKTQPFNVKFSITDLSNACLARQAQSIRDSQESSPKMRWKEIATQ